MTPSKIFKATRREREMTMNDFADVLGISTGRVSQIEKGENVSLERIQEWVQDARLPDWARDMAKQMWLAHLGQQLSLINVQFDALGHVLADCA